MSQRSVPAPFLTKTYQLVEDRITDDVVSWNENGTTFIVWKIDDFSKDLLPAYFKHNNFSSFVRQLNTYGFRKIVPDKWEFSNDNFKRGHKDLLTDIRRRKSITATCATQGGVKTGGAAAVSRPKSPSNSGEYLGSGSISTSSSQDSKNAETSNVAKFGVISQENEKLKKENEKLNSELAQTREELDKLIAVLGQYSQDSDGFSVPHKVGPNQLIEDGCMVVEKEKSTKNEWEDDNDENGECLKLFGVWMKEKKKKRGVDEIMDFGGSMKKSRGGAWMNMVGPYTENCSNVCN